MKEAYLDYYNEWKESGEAFVPMSADLMGDTYEEWLNKKIMCETIAPEGKVTAHTYFLFDSQENIVGSINIRHYLNEYLAKIGGHIGYGIRPSQRKKGYATKMLRLALPLAKKLGINRVLISCDKNNIGSSKTIINNGGILENEIEDNNSIIQRYWIELN